MRIGSVAVNHVRLVFAMCLLPFLHLAVIGSLVPSVGLRDLLLLVASGLVGMVLGDAAGFRALVLIGAARTTLVVTLTPAIAGILAYAFLGERIGVLSLVGMAVTLVGLMVGVAGRWVKQRKVLTDTLPARTLAIGLLCAVGGAAGQAIGQVLAKPALAAVDPLSATLVRVASATVLLWAFTAIVSAGRRARPAWWEGWRDRKALGLILLGTVAGPTCGVWLSQIATKHAPVGVAATLMALVPLFVLAEDAVLLKRRPQSHELLGALIAIAGVVLLVMGSVS